MSHNFIYFLIYQAYMARIEVKNVVYIDMIIEKDREDIHVVKNYSLLTKHLSHALHDK